MKAIPTEYFNLEKLIDKKMIIKKILNKRKKASHFYRDSV